MKILVKTASGSVYRFTQKDGRTFFRTGLISGEVVKCGTICTGKSIKMEIRKDGLYGTQDIDTTAVETSPVAEMEVTL